MAVFHDLVLAMEWVLKFFYGFTHSYGLAIVLLTIAVRVLIMPIYHRQMRSMRKMQELQPEMKRLQAKHKGDPKRLNQEMMDLYKRSGSNPLSGCLPTLIQLPFLWALFIALEQFPYVGDKSFLWLPSLSQPDPLYILPIVAAVTTFWQVYISTPQVGTERSQQLITYIAMPALFFYISMRYASGLSLYWVISTLFAVAQTYLIGVNNKKSPAPAATRAQK